MNFILWIIYVIAMIYVAENETCYYYYYSLTCCNTCTCFFLVAETPSPDEIEAYKVLQKCLELREKYMFREEVAPWEKEIITDPSTPKPNPNPFYYEQQTKTEVSVFPYIFCILTIQHVFLLCFLYSNFVFLPSASFWNGWWCYSCIPQ